MAAALRNLFSDKIELKLSELGLKITEMELMLKETAEEVKCNTMQSCAALLFNPNVPVFDAFCAAIKYFKLHGNGSGKERVVEMIMEKPENRQFWLNALNEDMKKNGHCEGRYFLDVIRWIETKIM